MLKLNITPEEEKIIEQSMANYKGSMEALESALGALLTGTHFGWRVLKIIHSPATYKKYENILGVKFQDICPEKTELSKKVKGYRMAEKLGSFWAVVTGKIKVLGKTQSTDDSDIEDHNI